MQENRGGLRPPRVLGNAQNWNRAESCIFRGGRTDEIEPKPFLLPVSDARLVGVVLVRLVTFNVVLMPSYCVWLNVLNVSRRTSKRALLDPDLLR